MDVDIITQIFAGVTELKEFVLFSAPKRYAKNLQHPGKSSMKY
jgi:hypothetical protein